MPSDMLVKLYELPDPGPIVKQVEAGGVRVFVPLMSQRVKVMEWVREKFGDSWAEECGACFFRQPVSCYIAVDDGKVIGFSCYVSPVKYFFGPLGVDESYRGRGIGKALTLLCLNEMKHQGFGYAIIGYVGPAKFYEECCGATVIEDSFPGVFANQLKPPK